MEPAIQVYMEAPKSMDKSIGGSRKVYMEAPKSMDKSVWGSRKVDMEPPKSMDKSVWGSRIQTYRALSMVQIWEVLKWFENFVFNKLERDFQIGIKQHLLKTFYCSTFTGHDREHLNLDIG